MKGPAKHMIFKVNLGHLGAVLLGPEKASELHLEKHNIYWTTQNVMFFSLPAQNQISSLPFSARNQRTQIQEMAEG